MVGENGEALGEGKNNFDWSYKIGTNLLLNKMKKKAQVLISIQFVFYKNQ